MLIEPSELRVELPFAEKLKIDERLRSLALLCSLVAHAASRLPSLTRLLFQAIGERSGLVDSTCALPGEPALLLYQLDELQAELL